MLRSVDLPLPETPSRTSSSPWCSAKSTPSSARTSTSPMRYVLRSSDLARTATGSGLAPGRGPAAARSAGASSMRSCFARPVPRSEARRRARLPPPGLDGGRRILPSRRVARQLLAEPLQPLDVPPDRAARLEAPDGALELRRVLEQQLVLRDGEEQVQLHGHVRALERRQLVRGCRDRALGGGAPGPPGRRGHLEAAEEPRLLAVLIVEIAERPGVEREAAEGERREEHRLLELVVVAARIGGEERHEPEELVNVGLGPALDRVGKRVDGPRHGLDAAVLPGEAPEERS